MEMVVDNSSASKSKRTHHHGVSGGGQKKQDESTVMADKISQIEKESTKMALEMNHGLMVEALKNFMFTNGEVPPTL